MRNVYNCLVEGSRLNYSGCRTQVVANEDNLSDVGREASRYFRNKKIHYLEVIFNELESNSKYKKIRDMYMGINESKNCYQPGTNFLKDERVDLLADPHKILNRWKNYLCQLLNVHGAGDVT
jgi:hypothetical protein